MIRVGRPWGRCGESEPLLPSGVVQRGQPGPVLVVPPCELNVVENDPPVGGKQLGQRGQAREEVRLVNGAHTAGRPAAFYVSCR